MHNISNWYIIIMAYKNPYKDHETFHIQWGAGCANNYKEVVSGNDQSWHSALFVRGEFRRLGLVIKDDFPLLPKTGT